jgi:hypothetical protein
MQSVQIVTFVLKKLDQQVRTTQHTPPSTVFEKLGAIQLFKKFPAFHGTQRFFTTFTRTYQYTIP